MKRILFLSILLSVSVATLDAQDLLKSVKSALGSNKSNAGSGLSNDDIVSGL
ncbi:MAG: DUF4197 domain-containing protein, partial [Bacteroidota bacterium]